MIVIVRYAIGYGSHKTELEFDEDATDEEIGRDVQDYVMDRLEWRWVREE